jgi:hypothetical protein
MLYRARLGMSGIGTLVVVGIDYIGNGKSNFHTIMIMTAPQPNMYISNISYLVFFFFVFFFLFNFFFLFI